MQIGAKNGKQTGMDSVHWKTHSDMSMDTGLGQTTLVLHSIDFLFWG